MTANQIAYWKQQEEARHNAAMEYETQRSNKAKEEENLRSNMAKEQENYRHNTVSESQDLFGLQTTAMHYGLSDEAYAKQAQASLAQAGAAAQQAAAALQNAQTNASNLDYAYWMTDQEMERFYGELAYKYAALDQNKELASRDRTKEYVTSGMRAASDLIRTIMPYVMSGGNNNDRNNGGKSSGGTRDTTPMIGANLEKIFGNGMSTILPIVGGSGSVLPLVY